MRKFILYTDGGCLGNRRDAGCIGGYGYLVLNEDLEILLTGGGKDEDVTNNMMEMTAVIEGIKALDDYMKKIDVSGDSIKLAVRTDSRYIVDNFYEYVPTWRHNGWRKRNGGTVLNKKLWKRIDELSRGFNMFRFTWVKAHANDRHNNMVDSIATSYMKGEAIPSQ